MLKLLETIEIVKNAITTIKSKGAKYHTNLFIEDVKLSSWINKRQVYVYSNETNFFILRDRNGFWQLYFATTCLEKLASDLQVILTCLNGQIVTDILGNAPEIKNILEDVGFASYMTLTRMLKLQNGGQIKDVDSNIFAVKTEAEQIEEILYENMDPLCEQIPDLDEIENAIVDKEVLVLRNIDTAKVSSFIMFRRKGITLELLYWVTKRQYQKMGLGSKLYSQYIGLNADVKRHTLWVRDDNDVANIYKSYGFKFDKLKDEVFLL